jgi:hypothetical protein
VKPRSKMCPCCMTLFALLTPLVLAACQAQFAIVKPADGSAVVANDNRISVVISLGSGDPQTFRCLLNGEDVTARFDIVFSQARADALEATPGRNTLVASIEDPHSGTTLEQTAAFFLFHLGTIHRLEGIEQAALSFSTNEMVVVTKESGSQQRYIKELSIDPAPALRTLAGPLTGPATVTSYANKFQYYLVGSPGDRSIYTIRIAADGTPVLDMYYQSPLLEGLASLAIFTPLEADETESEIGQALFAGVQSPQGGTSGAILRVNPDRTADIFLDGLETAPQAMLMDHKGSLVAAVGARLLWVSESGEILRSVSLPGGTRPISLGLNLDGDLFLLDSTSGSVKALTPEGASMTVLSGLNQPCAMAIDGKENLLVAEGSTGNILELTGELSFFGGDVSLASPAGPLKAYRYYTIALTYTAGRAGVPQGGGISVAYRVGPGWPPFQVSNPSAPFYVTASTDAQASLELGMGVGPLSFLGIRVAQGTVRAGEHIFIILGDTSQGSPGIKAPLLAQDASEIFIYEDLDGDGYFRNYLAEEILPAYKSVSFTVLPDDPWGLKAYAKSFVSPEGTADLVVRAVDYWGNTLPDYQGTVGVWDRASGVLLRELTFGPEDRGMKHVTDIALPGAGIHRLVVRDDARGFRANVNPILYPETPQALPYWGDLHGHTYLSDGIGTVAEYFAHARDVAHLDFAGVTDHTGTKNYGIYVGLNTLCEKSWEETKSAVRASYEPGRFVTLLGFENSSTLHGHRNVHYLADDPPFIGYHTIPQELHDKVRLSAPEGEVMIIPHLHKGVLGNQGIDWDEHAPDLELLVEMASHWGIKEYAGNPYRLDCDLDARNYAEQQRGNMVQDALARGYYLGFTAGSDNHNGNPGEGCKGRFNCDIFGHTGVWLDELTREALWDALSHRRTWATTGARILVAFSINGAPMGSRLEQAPVREIVTEVHAVDEISTVEIVKNNTAAFVLTNPGLDVVGWSVVDAPGAAVDVYYVRVIQQDGEIAWSSPIWVGVGQP